jgi:hypothetical protein
MALTAKNKKELLAYIDRTRKKGHTDKEIALALKKVGYHNEDIASLPLKIKDEPQIDSEEHLKDHHKQWFFAAAIIMVIILGVLFLLTTLSYTTSCQTELECFLEAAELCEEKTIEAKYGTSTLTIESTRDCTFKKYFAAIDPTEPELVKQLLEGKSMECAYDVKKVSAEDLASLTFDLDKCEGPLVASVQALQVQ